MEVVITGWALDSYFEMASDGVFSNAEYWSILRPDGVRLRNFPNDPKFENHKFWSIAEYRGTKIQDGYKMKWHQIGNGKVQLRLTVGILDDAFLCSAYVKTNESFEKRQLLKFRTRLDLIRRGTYTDHGRLT